MGKKPNGMMAAKKLVKRRKSFRFKRKGSKLRRLGGWKKYDPLEGAPMASGIVLKKKNVECKQPHSGLRKCAVIQLIKNGRTISAFMPGEGALKYVDEHDTVMVQKIGGPMGKSAGDIPGIKFKVVKSQGVSLDQLVKGKKEKPNK